ncbi:MAG: Phytoene synthase [uncultured Thermomicrobiales bacterium]|uniref:Phytoene synthase n=1 Tax=uncultured Thermomicrobiales bacterium TaxID=1645740 RepID=A0A6J4UKE3_9BACT|nr:MAG: Phytoene synthase [uncultured Thermomicrobiales bacterium]
MSLSARDLTISDAEVTPDPGGFEAAPVPDWDHCRDVLRAHGRTFSFGSQFLPLERRRAIQAAYAFCRVADDIVDRAPATGLAAAARALDAWETEIDCPRDPIAVAFAAARARYGVPEQPVRDLVAGVRMDLAPQTYATWAELEVYCYRVAGTVGLIAAPIFGCVDEAALPQAVDLGVAMQLTNILRDVAEDARMGRLYLPLEDLAAFGCDPEALLAGRPSGDTRGLLAFEIARARALYVSGKGGVHALSPAGRLTTIAIGHLYAKILHRIEEGGYDLLGPRAYVPTHRKLRAMPTITADFLRLWAWNPVRPRL